MNSLKIEFWALLVIANVHIAADRPLPAAIWIGLAGLAFVVGHILKDKP